MNSTQSSFKKVENEMVLNDGGHSSQTLFKAEKKTSHPRNEPKDLLKGGQYVTDGGLQSKGAKFNDSRNFVNVKGK